MQVNLWGVLVGGLSSMVIGAIYYSPLLFEKSWIKLAKINAKNFEKQRPKLLPLIFLGALLTAYFVAFFSFLYHNYFLDSWLGASLSAAFLLWVGISATTVIVHASLEQRPRQLIYITLGNRFLSLLAIGLLVGWLHP